MATKKKSTKVKGVQAALDAVKKGPKKRKSTAKKKTTKSKSKAKKTTTKRKSTAKKKTAVKKPKAKAKKTTSKTKPSSGQSGPAMDLPFEKISDKERKVLDFLNGSGSGQRPIMTITQMAEGCFKSLGAKKSNSWVRNCLRRLVRSGNVEKVERGQYRISDAGRKKLARAEAA